MSTSRTTPDSLDKTDTGGPASAGQEKILAALRELGQASPAAISAHTGLAYSTTTAKLRAMQATGLVSRQRQPDGTTTWAPGSNKPKGGTPPADSATFDTATGDQPTGDDPTGGKPHKAGKPRRPDKPANGSRERERCATATADTNQSSGTGTDRPDADNGTSAAAVAASAAATVAAESDTRPGAGSPDGTTAGAPRARRAKGQLRAQVLAVLQDQPDATFKVSQVCKHLPGASAGAIANALDKLVADGTAKQVADKPATYQAE